MAAAAASTLRRLLLHVKAREADAQPGHVRLTRCSVQALLCAWWGLSETRLNSRIELGVINKHDDASVCQWRNILRSRSCHGRPLFYRLTTGPIYALQTSVNESFMFKTKMSYMQNNSCTSNYRDPPSRSCLLNELRHFCHSCVGKGVRHFGFTYPC